MIYEILGEKCSRFRGKTVKRPKANESKDVNVKKNGIYKFIKNQFSQSLVLTFNWLWIRFCDQRAAVKTFH